MMLLLPIGDDLRLHRPPLATTLLITINVGVYAWEFLLPDPEAGYFILRWGLIPSRLLGQMPGVAGAADPWLTIFTSAFLHGGLLHLLGNMLFLWIFGNNVEDALGIVRYLLFYLLCAAFAGVLQSLVAPTSPVPMIGASGAISGVLAAYWVMFPAAFVKVFFWFIVMVRTFMMPAAWWILIWFAGQIWSAAAASPGQPGVAWYAHVGGFLGGIVLLFAVFPRWLETRRDNRRHVAWR